MSEGFTFAAYSADAARTYGDPNDLINRATRALGVSGEAGELMTATLTYIAAGARIADAVKKNVSAGHALLADAIEEEAGDVLWGLDACLALVGRSLEGAAKRNLEKRAKRYPNGFSPEASQANR